jgi:hypothetical protein
MSEGTSVIDPVQNARRFESFEIRRVKDVREITIRIAEGTFALFLSLFVLTIAAVGCVSLVRSGPQGFQPDPVLFFVTLPVVALVAIFMVLVTARRFLYWKVDQVGIHQSWLGFRHWSLPWNEIVSRRPGPVESPTWVSFGPLPIAGGVYQPLVLEDRQGRKRKVNRLGTNGHRLDAILRNHLNPTGEAHLAQIHADEMQRARAIHSRQGPAQVSLHLCTLDSPVVRMKKHEPRMLPVCCNCLGPGAVGVPISTSPGLLGYIDRFLRVLTPLNLFGILRVLIPHSFISLWIPLCPVCQARVHRGILSRIGPVLAVMTLICVGILFVGLAHDARLPRESALFLGLSMPFFLGALGIIWKETRRPSPAKLVRVVRWSFRGDWMEVQFGNPEYARLVYQLNEVNPDSGMDSCERPRRISGLISKGRANP